jgi:hypothetical protein
MLVHAREWTTPTFFRRAGSFDYQMPPAMGRHIHQIRLYLFYVYIYMNYFLIFLR